jgi:hypothetical protein
MYLPPGSRSNAHPRHSNSHPRKDAAARWLSWNDPHVVKLTIVDHLPYPFGSFIAQEKTACDYSNR